MEYIPFLAGEEDVWESINRNFKLVELSKWTKDFQVYFEDEKRDKELGEEIDEIDWMFKEKQVWRDSMIKKKSSQ